MSGAALLLDIGNPPFETSTVLGVLAVGNSRVQGCYRAAALVLCLTASTMWVRAAPIDLSIPGPVLPSRAIPGTLHADVDGDGRIDGLETGRVYDGYRYHLTLIVHRNLGVGSFQTTTFSTPWMEQTSNGFGVGSLVAVDLTGDGQLDVHIEVDELRASCVVHDLVTMINDGTGSFLFGQTWAVGPNIQDVFVQDLGSDRLPEIVAVARDWACYDPKEVGRLLVWRNLGRGQFGNPVDYPPGSTAPRDPVAIGDLDLNGTPDIVMSGLGAYLPNVVGGSFGLPVVFGPAATALWLGVLELSGDGANDIARIHAAGIDAYVNDGTGHFSARSLSMVAVTQFLVRDLNLDGRADFVTGGNGLVGTLVSDGSGGFTTATYMQGVTQPFVPTDLDANGREDLVGVHTTGCFALLQQPDGTFVQRVYGAGSEQPVQVADLDANGAPDLLLATASTTSILFNDGSGSFTPTTVAAGSAQPVLRADLDVDGYPDLILRTPPLFTSLRNGGDRSLEVLPTYFGAPLYIEDADGDTRPDVLGQHPDGVVLFRGVGDGRFIAPRRVVVGRSPVAWADFDRDGRPDVLAANVGENGFAVVPASGPGTFAAPRTVDWNDTQSATFRDAVVADFDADGGPDVAIVRVGRVSVFLNQGPSMLFGPLTNYVDQAFPTAITSGDFDGDGDADLVTNGWTDLTLLLRNDGTGAFTGPEYLSLGDPRAFAAADLDNDRKLDLVVRTPADVRVSWGRGDGSFEAPVQVTPVPASYTDRVQAADLDDDGARDLVLHGPYGLHVVRNRGGRSFDGAARVSLEFDAETVGAADLDGDGTMDLIATTGAAAIAVLRHVAWSFQPVLAYRLPLARSGAVVADWTNDGQPDLLVTDALFENRTNPSTPTAVHDLRAGRSDAGVEITWRLEDAASLRAILVHRAESAAGPFGSCGAEPLAPARTMTFLDETALAHLDYWYQLVGETDTGAQRVLASIQVPAFDKAWSTGLIGVRSLASRAIEVRFTVGRGPTRVHLALHDVRGRRVLQGPQETLAPGTYLRVLPASGTDGPPLPRGVYFLRFRAGAIEAARKVVLLGRSTPPAP